MNFLTSVTMPNFEAPAFLASFEWAVVRLATFALPNQGPRLLFGSVSLISKQRPKPDTRLGLDQFPIGLKKEGRVYFRETLLAAPDALEWYRSAKGPAFLTPVPSFLAERDPRLDGQPLAASQMADDPDWPSLGLPVGTEMLTGQPVAAPFLGTDATRLHRTFGDDHGFEALTTNPAAVAFVRRRVHIDLSSYTEYLGSLVLIVPDPIVKNIHHYVVPEGENGPERLVYRLIPRVGQSLAALKLTVVERRADLLSRFETVEVPANGLVVVPRKVQVQASGYALTHPDHGVLAYQPPLPFLRTVTTNLIVAKRRVKIATQIGEGPNAPSDQYEVTEISSDAAVASGGPPSSALSRIFQAEEKRSRQARGEQHQQTWFERGERTKALSFLRRQLVAARSYVLVADPYFGGRQITQVLHAVPRSEVAFTILTSRLAFEDGSTQKAEAAGPAAKPRERDGIAEFRSAMSSLAERGMRNVTALVMKGKVPPLHDRFLVIDDSVWFLGNSLNALGDRASLILQVPNGDPILTRLRQMAADATPFESYAARWQRPGRARVGA